MGKQNELSDREISNNKYEKSNARHCHSKNDIGAAAVLCDQIPMHQYKVDTLEIVKSGDAHRSSMDFEPNEIHYFPPNQNNTKKCCGVSNCISLRQTEILTPLKVEPKS